jgi:hypothetical protein
MQQRRLRLGDILDDYCPRERRITNHVIVAMIEDDIRRTRCTTCDAEHEYKQAKAPAPRRKKAGALSQEVHEDARPRAVVAAPAAPEDEPLLDSHTDDAETRSPDLEVPASTELSAAAEPPDTAGFDTPEDDRRAEDDGPVHRRLIRATLPRPEGHVPERKEPEFTIRQPGREANGNRPGHRRGHRPARQAQGQAGGHNRFGNQRHGSGAPRHGSGAPQGSGQGHGHGQRHGNRPGQPSSNRGGGGRPGGQNRGPGRKRGR